MGGVDEDVKKYFFNLPQGELISALQEYQRIHGRLAGEYAFNTFNSWRTGRRAMSGLVAKRLFALLPGRMPLKDKYMLVESLWKFKGPRSTQHFFVGTDATLEEIHTLIEAHFTNVVQPHTIPSDIVKRFSWLANGDVGLQQQLCNHFASLEQPILLQGLAQRLPLFLQHIRSSVGTSVVQNFIIGNHEVILHFESVPGTIKAGNPPGSAPTNGSSQGGYGCLIWIVAGILSIILWANK
jgi:hypothetical protein